MNASCALRTYQSIPDIPFPTVVRRHRSSKGFLVLLAVLSIGLLASLPSIIPTQHERSLANRYELNVLTSARRIRNAQSLADSSRLAFLSPRMEDLHHALRNIENKGAGSHYLEPPEGCEATVVILRHCEKGHIREHCDYMGYERSVYISSLFGDGDERWPAPSFVYAEGPGERRNKKKMNFREIETVGPLSKKIGVAVDDRYVLETTIHMWSSRRRTMGTILTN